MEIPNQYIKNLYKVSLVFLVVLILFFAVKSLTEWRSLGAMVSNTITLSGHGEVSAVSDIASVYFTISKDAATVKDAQAAVAVIEKKALDLLKTKNASRAKTAINPTTAAQNAPALHTRKERVVNIIIPIPSWRNHSF